MATPELITRIELDPVETIYELLQLLDPARTDPLISAFRGLITNKPASRATARCHVMTAFTIDVDRDIAKTKTEIANLTGVSVSSISQTAKRFADLVGRHTAELRNHALVSYIASEVGRIANLDDLPRWVQLLILTTPSPKEDDWGTNADIAQFVTALALRETKLIRVTTTEPQLWLTPNGIPLIESLDQLTDDMTGHQSISATADELIRALQAHNVSNRHHRSVSHALIENKNAIWIPSADRYIIFDRQNQSRRRSRGNAQDRARDILQLLPHVESQTLRNDIVEQFVNQHKLGRQSAEAAVKSHN